ncbi:hypothetical protein F2P81_007215 [Scophthalmus maximus]|uniref:PHD and RING finger domain-containing protein 1 n=1 Tax=Scophthalmus maximus TaxID=52904 RepID=A0A6A4T520_SCOMX|nr:hypothetical protein F2P81_007215 [Scophthalmus maximus]
MDEDENQDEFINRSATQSKGKRAALWAISDDSDDVEEESEEGESDSGEEDEEEDHLDGEDDDDEEEDDEEEDAKPEDGTSADLAGMSSDEDAEKCPICLNSFRSQPVATPESCEHYFCLDCILEWTKNANSCPVDRIAFNSIYLRKCYGGKVKKMITVQKPVKEGQEEVVDLDLEQTNCEVCGGSDREDRLLLCDGCDSGFHMECLTPPLDSVPVEEWFCPECVANNRHSRDSAEGVSDAEIRPSTARPATSRTQTRTGGPIRAIARTQQSERVRANVNRHRITQARTSQSTWLDETINAVVAGLNTSVYIRDLTPRMQSGRRRRTGKRRKVRRKTTSAKGNTASTGVRRRKRRVRRTRSRRKLVVKKTATSRGRIANNLGIVKDKKSSSLPTVYRPSENTLSSMRSDIGAASLSIYGDPFDLDPFVEREEVEQQARVTSLLEAKRRGISRSALRSHQPVARPVTASLSRRGMDVPQSVGVVDAAPVPDLLSSILSGQSMLLMDSSDVVINRDGSLKATKSTIDTQPDLPTRGHPRLQPPRPNRPTPSHGQRETNEVRASRENSSSSTHTAPSSNSKSNGVAPSQSQFKKTHAKPMWVDVSVLPRIPKIKRESGGVTNDGTSQGGSNRIGSSKGSGSNSTASSNGYGMPETGMNSLAGDKNRQQSVDQQKGRADGQAQRHRPDGAASSSAFSNSFSSSSSSTGSPSSQLRHSSSSSSSSAVSFRINASGNSWQARRPSVASSSASGGSVRKHWREKEDEAKKRQLHRDKQILLASRALVNKEEDRNNVYDPFNPTLSDSSSSDSEAESSSLDKSSRHASHEGNTPSSGNDDLVQSKQVLVHVKTEPQETEVSQEQPRRANALEPVSQRVRCSQEYVKVEKESRLVDIKVETMVKKEPDLDDTEEEERCHGIKMDLNSDKADTTTRAHHSLDLVKTEEETLEEESERTRNSAPPDCRKDSSASSSGLNKRKKTGDSQSESPSRDLGRTKKSAKAPKERSCSSSETDRGRRGDHHASGQGGRQKEKEKDGGRSSRRSRSRERRRARSTSQSSQSTSPDGTSSKRRRSSSRSKDRRRSRSISGSSSRERSRRKNHKQRSTERNDGSERDRKRGRMPQDKRRDKRQLQENKKEKSIIHNSLKEEKIAKRIKQEFPSCTSNTNVKKEDKDLGADHIATTAEMTKEEVRVVKVIKKEKPPSLDIFEDYPITKSIKKEEIDACSLPVSTGVDKAVIEEDLTKTTQTWEIKTEPCEIKTEPCEITIKSEPSSPISCHSPCFTSTSTFTSSVAAVGHLDAASQTVRVKQEVLQPSDSDDDDDFNVDVMLDSLDYVKSEERTEGSGAEVKQEKEVEEGKKGEEQVLPVVGAKAKTQVKRVTWNIQEPEGPQPQKSPSKLALYKLKLKQEGARRPSSTVQTSSQDIAGAVGESSKKGAVAPPTTPRRSDGLHPQGLSVTEQGEAEEGDVSRKDQYLKKLHMQERAIEEVKLAIKPFYQRRDINKDEYKEILRKAVQKVCHSKSGEINPVKVGNLVKAYVDKYKHARKQRKGEDLGNEKVSDSP